MDARVAGLKTLKDCELFAKNVLERNRPDLAQKAHKRTLELRAENYGAKSQAERDCVVAVYAYEEVLAAQKGRKTRASKMWYLIKSRGAVSAIENAVNRKVNTTDYAALRAIGLQDCAFEAVVLRYPDLFLPDTVLLSAGRFDKWKRAQDASQHPA